MKTAITFTIAVMAMISCFGQTAKISPSVPKAPKNSTGSKSLFLDVHNLQPGKVRYADVVAAHEKDLAIQGKYHVNLLKFWFDEMEGKVYCLSSAPDSQSVINTHAEAHGLLPAAICRVTGGVNAGAISGIHYYMDIHNMGPGKVTAAAVAEAHKKDLAVQKKHGVNLINYWVDEVSGTVYCLSQAPDPGAITHMHREAHGLLPDKVIQVQPGE